MTLIASSAESFSSAEAASRVAELTAEGQAKRTTLEADAKAMATRATGLADADAIKARGLAEAAAKAATTRESGLADADIARARGDANADDGGNCFVAFKVAKKTRAAAELACEADLMTLAIITTAASNATTQSLIAGLDAWLGATDVVTENAFLWPDNTPLTFKNFRAGEPNNGDGGGQEDCLVIEGGKGGSWDDRSCAVVAAYVCSFSR